MDWMQIRSFDRSRLWLENRIMKTARLSVKESRVFCYGNENNRKNSAGRPETTNIEHIWLLQ
jgi:hypothetical protein